jgi:hypothetical protein
MAAGLGFKDFTTGEVLTAADVDGYLMQGVWVFASAAARDAAVTSPQEGNFAYLKDTNVTTYYTGSAWANLDTTGMTNPMTTTGDTIYSSSGSTPARLGIGSTGQVLTVASGVPSWATPAGGSITTGYAAVNVEESTTSATFTDLTTAGPAVTLTTGTKVLVILSHYANSDSGTAAVMGYDISGATSYSAGFDEVSQIWNNGAGSSVGLQHSYVSYKTVTAGSNTFTAKYRKRGGSGTAQFDFRHMTVMNLGS